MNNKVDCSIASDKRLCSRALVEIDKDAFSGVNSHFI